MARGSCSTASRTSIPAEAQASVKTPPAPKKATREPVTLSESTGSSSEEGTGVAPLDISPIQVMGAIIIGGQVAKKAQTAETTTEGRAAKCTRTLEPARASPSPLADKRKKAVEHLASSQDNELLSAAEVTVESTLTSMAEMLSEKMFGGSLMFLIPASSLLLAI